MTTYWARTQFEDDRYVVREIYQGDPLFPMVQEAADLWHPFDRDEQDVQEGWIWNGEVFSEPPAPPDPTWKDGNRDAWAYLLGKLNVDGKASYPSVAAMYADIQNESQNGNGRATEFLAWAAEIIEEGLSDFEAPDFEQYGEPPFDYEEIKHRPLEPLE